MALEKSDLEGLIEAENFEVQLRARAATLRGPRLKHVVTLWLALRRTSCVPTLGKQ